jgi:hypothetical protein
MVPSNENVTEGAMNEYALDKSKLFLVYNLVIVTISK